MKKLLPVFIIAIILLAGWYLYTEKKASPVTSSNTTLQKETPSSMTAQPAPYTGSTANWEKLELPNWEIVSFKYPTGWLKNIFDANNIKLSKNTATINIYYKADDRLTKPPKAANAETQVKNDYINSLGNLASGKKEFEIANGRSATQFEILINNQKEIHTVFYVGTLLVDVYTQSFSDGTYSGIIDTFQYGGY